LSFEERIKDLGLHLPRIPEPVASYVPAVLAGDIIYVSGQLPLIEGKIRLQGKLGDEITVEEGREAAKICTLNCLASAKSVIGSLDNIERVVKVTGFIACAPGFSQQPQVLNGASNILIEIFGDVGRHSRSAVGVSSLPLNAPVEVEMILKIRSG
jgi:enamine deaminase RidA (YjgF/YER057c/UK114 family)